MPSFTSTTPTEGSISLAVQRNVGDLQERAMPSWLQRVFGRTRHDGVPTQSNGLIQSTLTLKPSLFGRVLRVDPDLLFPEQVQKMRELLAENVPLELLVAPFRGTLQDYGLLSLHTVTDTGVTALAAGFAGAFTISNFKFHAFGTGTTAEAEAHSNLVTEVANSVYGSNSRPTGSQANTAAAGGPPEIATYTTIATFSPVSGGTIAVTEHAIFAAANGTGGGANTMWDRSVFSAINLVAGSDSLQVTYNLSLTANG